MSESKVREFKAIEARAALRAANTRKVEGPRVLDGFGRRITVDDGLFLTEAQPMNVIWRVSAITPATEPKYQGGAWLDVVSTTRVLMMPNLPNTHAVLVALAPEPEQEEKPAETPGAAVTPSGIILSDPDGMSER